MEHDDGSDSPNGHEKHIEPESVNFSNENARMAISDTEWTNANRAFRTATWAACFYLITTDILGPFGIG